MGVISRRHGRNGNNSITVETGRQYAWWAAGAQRCRRCSLIPADGDGNDDGAADVRVVADEENNSLMIYSTGMQYKTIKAAVEKLDVPPTQVLIEASIVEVYVKRSAEVRIGVDV